MPLITMVATMVLEDRGAESSQVEQHGRLATRKVMNVRFAES
jgi:hypothetical protein